ncbi:unnamed protein product [Paramecium pentaurelia]|uniref:Ion transport domain-containing protein n=1 Tax=Paramecium pentaurelia TaxID=43138 RepID=A0A8S1XB44_9CILI|nr:unnamed protein product [Paramecium pentaurelia]
MLQLSMQIRNSKVETRKSYQQKKFQLKSSTIKKILFLLYFVGIFQLENKQIIVDLMNISLLMIQIWRHNTKIQISNIDRFDLTICFCALISRQTIPQLQSIILSLCFFSFKNNLSTILKSVKLLKKIKNLSITIIFIILLTSYLFTYLYHSYEQTYGLFGTFSNTCITMLEILTLDSWGSRGRILEQQVGYTGIPSIIICAYVFLMNYFYMNILIGLILETLQLEQNQQLVQVNFLDEHEMKEQKINKKLSDNTHICNLMLGQFYQQIVMVFSIVSVIFNIYNNFMIVDNMGKLFDALDDILYSIHFIFLLFLDKPRIQYERSKWERMLLHFIAGPLALFLSHDLACLCNLCKLATTPIVRGIFSGTISIFPILFPIITVLLAIILLMAVYTSRFYSSFIGFKGETYYTTLQQAFYTFVQLLTLDDWDANVLPVFESQQIIMPYILFPCFIIISNVILLNILIACSCKYFKEIDYSINCQSLNEAHPDNLLVKLNKVAELQIPIINCNTPNTIQESHISQREGLVQICYNNKIINALLVK